MGLHSVVEFLASHEARDAMIVVVAMACVFLVMAVAIRVLLDA